MSSIKDQIRSDQSLSRVRLFATPWITTRQASLSITSSRSSPKLMSIESVTPSSHLILCRPLLLLPPIPPTIRVFSNESNLLMRWPKYWSFSFSIIPSKEHPGLISFRMDWLDPLAVQGTLKNLLQHHSSKASVLRCSAFFMVQLSHLYLTTGKTMAPNYLRPATMTLSSSFSLMILPSLRDSTVSSVWNGFPTPCPAEEGPHFFFQGLLRPPGQNESLASVCFLIFLKRAWKQAMFFFFLANSAHY